MKLPQTSEISNLIISLECCFLVNPVNRIQYHIWLITYLFKYYSLSFNFKLSPSYNNYYCRCVTCVYIYMFISIVLTEAPQRSLIRNNRARDTNTKNIKTSLTEEKEYSFSSVKLVFFYFFLF